MKSESLPNYIKKNILPQRLPDLKYLDIGDREGPKGTDFITNEDFNTLGTNILFGFDKIIRVFFISIRYFEFQKRGDPKYSKKVRIMSIMQYEQDDTHWITNWDTLACGYNTGNNFFHKDFESLSFRKFFEIINYQKVWAIFKDPCGYMTSTNYELGLSRLDCIRRHLLILKMGLKLQRKFLEKRKAQRILIFKQTLKEITETRPLSI